MYKKVYIKQKTLKSIHMGHPWIFSGAVDNADNTLENGELCEVYHIKEFCGIGYYNKNSEIRIRFLTRINQEIDLDFFIDRIKKLYDEKFKYLENTNAFRLICGESDGFPGLITDFYNGVLVVQIHTLGMEKLKKLIVEALIKVVNPETIFEKSDTNVRVQEGLPKEAKQYLYGKEIKEIEINEHGFKFMVNIVEGQKTGFFLDQRENRLSLTKYSKNKKVLNCFSYTGGFSVYAAKNAKTVTSVDISKPATEYAKVNFKLNNYDITKHEFLAVDVFDYLKDLEKGKYDLIILDPPSFAKNKKQLVNAIKAYTTINSKALEKLNDYDILVSSSCTAHIDTETFIKILHQSSVNTGCSLRVLESNFQPQDHNYNLNYPEGRYLKFFVLQKIPIL